jgi:hypothetical protein
MSGGGFFSDPVDSDNTSDGTQPKELRSGT